MQFQQSLPSNKTSILKTHPNNMKSQHLSIKSPNLNFSGRRVGKGIAAMFAAALAMGLGAGSILAQGPYYPQVNPLGGGTFEPNGVQVLSNSELNAIEVKLAALNLSMVVPTPSGKTLATSTQYATAVGAVALDRAAVGGATAVTAIEALAKEVAVYRGGAIPVPFNVASALEAVASGVIASGAANIPTQLAAAGGAAAAANPGQLGSADQALFLNRIGADSVLYQELDSVTAAMLSGAVSTSGASVVTGAAVDLLLKKVVIAVNSAPVADSAKALQIKSVASAGVLAILTPGSALNRSVNLDYLTSGLTLPSATVDLDDIIATIKLAAGAITPAQARSIAQGALRNVVNRNSAGYADIKLGLGANSASDDLVDAFAGYSAPTFAVTTGLLANLDPVSVAAAGALKFFPNAAAIVKDVLVVANPGPGASAQDIVEAAAAAAQGKAVDIATLSAAGFGGATAADIAAGAIKGGAIGSAGAIAKAVASNAANLNAVQAPLIASAAIASAAAVSPSGNTQDGYADISYNVGFALRGAGAAGDTRSGAAVAAMVNAINVANGGNAATSATYIAVVAALAGNQALNATAILAAGKGAVVGDDNGAMDDGASLVAALKPLTLQPTASYAATLLALSTGGSAARDRALLYAAIMTVPSDAVGGLAAVIAKSNVASSTLIQDAISANRIKQANLAVAGEVARYVKQTAGQSPYPTIASLNIQAYIGQMVLANQALAADIAVAGTVTAPQFSHFVAHAVAFNAPKTAYLSAAGILNHSLFTATTGTGGVDRLTSNDRPSAVAAISAAFATGIIESRDLTPTDRTAALRDVVRHVVTSLGGTTYTKYDGAVGFRRSDGSAGGFTTTSPARGVAGAVTGYVAQLATAGPVNLLSSNFTDITTALTSISAAAGAAGFKLDIAQAAAQAIGWVSGQVAPAGVAAAIANAIFLGYAPGVTLAQITNAANFGLSEANGGAGVPGVGAAGLRASVGDPFYNQRSASGTPVSNILSL